MNCSNIDPTSPNIDTTSPALNNAVMHLLLDVS
jgi:hypothetical protein